MIKELIETYKLVKANNAKKKRYNDFLKQPLNYDILQDFINMAAGGAEINITLSDGTKLEIRYSFDKQKKQSEYF